ncbi:MAG: MerR family transcriptional regulator [Micromonosporaceae bacterium]|nr:MerR family transcriptional regulator [Micromonosporaceae bacterium]
MDLISIGEAARRLGLNTSALRYYEERGLVRAVARRGGKRMYDTDQLRRLVLVQIMQQLGIPLDAAAAVLDESSDAWREHLALQIRRLDDLIARASLARDFLSRARNCRADHPVAQCPKLVGIIDRRLAGVSFEQLVREHAAPVSRAGGSDRGGRTR